MNEAHEGDDCLFASQRDSPEAFEFIEEAFDLMAFLVEPPVDRRRRGATKIGLDLRRCTEVVDDERPERIGVIGGIGNDVADARQAVQQGFGLRTVAILAWRRMDTDWQADGIDGGMKFGRQPTA